MAYHDDLIQQAIFLSELNRRPAEPKQVDLRRAVSAAYYGLFHLLTREAAQNWKHQRQRDRFSRMFEHGRMKRVAESRLNARSLPVDHADRAITDDLRLIADSFLKLQQARHTADYDNSLVWSRTEVWEMIILAQEAMAAWAKVRETEIAQNYLLDLIATR